MAAKIIIDTSRFGKLEIDPEGVINLTEGLLGFPGQLCSQRSFYLAPVSG
jgi:hypothetical protein